MPKRSGKLTGLQLLMLSFGLAALALTILTFSLSWRSPLKWSLRGWMVELRWLVIYWPQTTIWFARFPGCILRPLSWPPIGCVGYVGSPFPYAHIVVHIGATVLAFVYASSLRRSTWFWGGLSLLVPNCAPIILALLKPKPVGEKAGLTRICARCGQERKRGRHYAFHYGKLLSTRGVVDLPYLGRRSTYRVEGTERAWICRLCLIERVFLNLGLGLVLLGVLPFGMRYAEGSSDLFKMIYVLASLAGLFLSWTGLRETGVRGERLAIQARRDELEAAGFDGFFDHRQFSKLELSRRE